MFQSWLRIKNILVFYFILSIRIKKEYFNMKNKMGLCLAGGGVKGAAHIGAIKALEEKNIKFEYVGGTSSR